MRSIFGIFVMVAMLVVSGCVSLDDRQDRATELSPGQTYRGLLGPGSKMFTFSLDRPSRVFLESSTPPSRLTPTGPNARLLDADGQLIAEDWNSGEGSNFRIDTTLPEGVWYLDVSEQITCKSLRCDNGERSFSLDFDARAEAQ